MQRLHHRWLGRGWPRDVSLFFHALDDRHHDAFVRAVGTFLDAGYRPVASPDALTAPADERRLWISLDDSFQSWYHSRALFDRLGVRATFYVNTGVFRDRAMPAVCADFLRRVGHAGDPRTLAVDELCALHADGHVVGAHTHTHPVLTRLPDVHARAEIQASLRALRWLTGAPVRTFAYPYGFRRHATPALDRFLAAQGVTTVAMGVPAMLHAPPAPGAPTRLHRHLWRFERSHDENLADLCTDGRLFERWTGRSAVG